jgi:hypothetical protein
MKTGILTVLFLSTICCIQCQVKKNNIGKIATKSEGSSIISYDEYSKKESVTLNNKKYQVLVNLNNKEGSTVKYKDELYSDREAVINVKSEGSLVFNKIIQKSAFQEYYNNEELNNLLIYNCQLNTSNDTTALFRLKFNICEPETDNCRFFNLDFKENGEYIISEEEISNEGEE